MRLAGEVQLTGAQRGPGDGVRAVELPVGQTVVQPLDQGREPDTEVWALQNERPPDAAQQLGEVGGVEGGDLVGEVGAVRVGLGT
ncbi:hypothetical protein [Dactylosporangium darangshiense]|uniref:hypothetical protein n=1 Tax=Dactylosporangium darangshiense TaxID=579108 RepID=UPI00362C2937